MRVPRRRFLGSSLVALGGGLLEALATPLWKWNRSLILEAAQAPKKAAAHSAAGSGAAAGSGGVQFVDVAKEAGLTLPNVWGEIDHKRYIIEAKGSGLAFFDYDNDGWLDIYLTNGTRFEPDWKPGEEPTSHLYKNNRDGTFTDVTAKSGLARTGWQTGVCVGDYDNDGWDDLFCCFWGHNILFRNNGDGTFTDVTKQAGLYREETRWGSGCTWIDYDRDGHLDLFVCNYIKLDPEETPVKHGEPAHVPVERHSDDVRPARIARRHEHSLSQQRRRNFHRRHGESRHFEARTALFDHRGFVRFRQRRLARYLCRRRFGSRAFCFRTITTARSPITP